MSAEPKFRIFPHVLIMTSVIALKGNHNINNTYHNKIASFSTFHPSVSARRQTFIPERINSQRTKNYLFEGITKLILHHITLKF